MYIVSLHYFDSSGHCLGDGSMLAPGTDPHALREYIKAQDSRTFCGFSPAYIYALPESGEPVLVKLGGQFYER